MKKITHFLLLIVMLHCSFIANAYDFSLNGIYYNYTTGLEVEVAYGGDINNPYYDYSGTIVIPSSISYNGQIYSVTSIGDGAFAHCGELREVIIPESVTSIGDDAFAYCGELREVTIPESVTSIGDGAFAHCGELREVTIPESVTSIGDGAFAYCGELREVTIPESVASIGGDAFSGTAWYNNHPDGMLYLDKWLIGYKGMMIPDSLSTIDIEIKDGTRGIAGGVFANCPYFFSITIPTSVTSIGAAAFSNCSGLTSVTISEGVTSIENSAFYGCSSLTSICLPSSLTSIGEYAFSDCRNLTSITMSSNVTSVGRDVLTGTAWYDNQPRGVIYWGDWVVGYKYGMPENTSIELKDGTKGIVDRAFHGCNGLTSIMLPASLRSIGDEAFYACSKLTSIILPEGLVSIGANAFHWCGLYEITIPSSVASIGNYAFYDCPLKSIVILDGMMTIGKLAFMLDFYAESQVIITSYAVVPPLCYPMSFGGNHSGPVYVPIGAVANYQQSVGWNQFSNIIGMESSICAPEIFSSHLGKGNQQKIYNLRGHSVVNPMDGIYIIGGKKVLIK